MDRILMDSAPTIDQMLDDLVAETVVPEVDSDAGEFTAADFVARAEAQGRTLQTCRANNILDRLVAAGTVERLSGERIQDGRRVKRVYRMVTDA